MGGGGSKESAKNFLKQYDVERVVGKGGFGKVNAVKHKKTKEWAAMKTLDKLTIVNSGQEEMVFNELRLLKMLETRGSSASRDFLVRLKCASQSTIHCYVLLDLCLGGDMRYWLDREKTFSEPRTKFYIASLCLAVEALHSINVIHRDIKPENIVLDERGYPKLTDLGISQYVGPPMAEEPSFGGSEDHTCTSSSGTEIYMAPEALTQPKHTYAADYFSVGLVAFEYLTGELPWQPKIAVDVMRGHEGWCKKQSARAEENRDIDRASIRAEILADGGGYPPVLKVTEVSTVQEMLLVIPEFRLGGAPREKGGGLQEIKKSSWLSGFDWDALQNGSMKAEFVPDTKRSNCDTGGQDTDDMFFEDEDDEEAKKLFPDTPENRAIFEGYEYTPTSA